MSPSPSTAPGYARQLWHKWKALRLPWRRQFLVGADLAGNTFWEFKDALNANRWRRIVRYPRKTHYADIKISPQWHQWLRHTRDGPPSIQEQQYDVSRQAMMKQLAAQADERWKSVPSYLDTPAREQPTPAIETKDPGGYAPPTEEEGKQGVRNGVEVVGEEAGHAEKDVIEKKKHKRNREENPWNVPQTGAPSENWQPESWTPGAAQRR